MLKQSVWTNFPTSAGSRLSEMSFRPAWVRLWSCVKPSGNLHSTTHQQPHNIYQPAIYDTLSNGRLVNSNQFARWRHCTIRKYLQSSHYSYTVHLYPVFLVVVCSAFMLHAQSMSMFRSSAFCYSSYKFDTILCSMHLQSLMCSAGITFILLPQVRDTVSKVTSITLFLMINVKKNFQFKAVLNWVVKTAQVL